MGQARAEADIVKLTATVDELRSALGEATGANATPGALAAPGALDATPTLAIPPSPLTAVVDGKKRGRVVEGEILKCTVCAKVYKNPGSLRRHMILAHKGQVQASE